MLGTPSRYWLPALLLAGAFVGAGWVQQPTSPSSATTGIQRATVKQFVTKHCTHCHNSDDKKAGLALDAISSEDIGAHPVVWEKVVRKLSSRQMPPLGRPRPDERTYDAFVAALEAELDRVAAAHPNPGRTATMRRLNRTEYQNAVDSAPFRRRFPSRSRRPVSASAFELDAPETTPQSP
jgi:hypothetical protein